jgi:import inner membrane translocase subunit TIM10
LEEVLGHSHLQRRRLRQLNKKLKWSPTCSIGTGEPEAPVECQTNRSCRLTQSCAKKCIPNDYREAELNRGESVCLDRCVSKFFEVNVKVSEKMQGDAQAKQGGGIGMGI